MPLRRRPAAAALARPAAATGTSSSSTSAADNVDVEDANRWWEISSKLQLSERDGEKPCVVFSLKTVIADLKNEWQVDLVNTFAIVYMEHCTPDEPSSPG